MVVILADAEQTEAVQELNSMLQDTIKHDFSHVVYDRIVDDRIPKFLYFDEYYQMKGQDNLDALKNRVDSNSIEESDYPLLGLIELAGLKLEPACCSGSNGGLVGKA